MSAAPADEALVEAAQDAGLIDLDCLKMLPPSNDAAEVRIATMKAAKPHLFARNALTMSEDEYARGRERIVRQVTAEEQALQHTAHVVDRLKQRHGASHERQ